MAARIPVHERLTDLTVSLRRVKNISLNSLNPDHIPLRDIRLLQNNIATLENNLTTLDSILTRSADGTKRLASIVLNPWKKEDHEHVARVRIGVEQARDYLFRAIEECDQVQSECRALNVPAQVMRSLLNLRNSLHALDAFIPHLRKYLDERLRFDRTHHDFEDIIAEYIKEESEEPKTLDLEFDNNNRYSLRNHVSINDEIDLQRIIHYKTYLIGITTTIITATGNSCFLICNAVTRYQSVLQRPAPQIDFLELGLIGDEVSLYLDRFRDSLTDETKAVIDAFVINHASIMNQFQKWKNFKNSSAHFEKVYRANAHLFDDFSQIFQTILNDNVTFNQNVGTELSFRVKRLDEIKREIGASLSERPAVQSLRHHFVTGVKDVLLFIAKTISEVALKAREELAARGGKFIAAGIIALSIAFLRKIEIAARELAAIDPDHFQWLKNLYDLMAYHSMF